MRRKLVAGFTVLLLAGLSAIIAIPELNWRAEVIVLQARGKLVGIGWADLLPMLRPGSPIYLESITKTHNAYSTIRNPRIGISDMQRGSDLFAERCAGCHGNEGRGGSVRDLRDNPLKNGSSDWSLYRSIRDGIPNTGMAPQEMPGDDRWAIVAYLQTLISTSELNRVSEVTSRPYQDVTAARIGFGTSRDQANWLTYSGSYAGDRFSTLDQINPSNVSSLALVWAMQTNAPGTLQATPIVNGDYAYVTIAPSSLVALDSSTGQEIWRDSWELQSVNPSGHGPLQNRGAAIFKNRVYVGTIDARLRALDAVSGELVWQAQVGDPKKNYSITSAPLAIPGKVIVGVSGGTYGARGYIDAYDAATGERLWRFYTVPKPDQPGGDTWSDNSWELGGGAPWVTGSYNPKKNRLFWGTGHATPSYFGANRLGDNLYTSSALSIDADTGTLDWHFQFTPHGLHGWDSAQVPILADLDYREPGGSFLLWPNRNAFFYLIDQTSGKFQHASPFAQQTWAKGIDPEGRPIPIDSAKPGITGTLVYPQRDGAANWWPASYSPVSGLLYVPSIDRPDVYFSNATATYESGAYYEAGVVRMPGDAVTHHLVRAIEPKTGNVVWETELSQDDRRSTGGTLSTSSGLVFAADGNTFFALDHLSGEVLWKVNLGGQIRAAPISYQSNGRQFVTIVGHRTIYTFGLPETATHDEPN